jgi:hypothetical protein
MFGPTATDTPEAGHTETDRPGTFIDAAGGRHDLFIGLEQAIRLRDVAKLDILDRRSMPKAACDLFLNEEAIAWAVFNLDDAETDRSDAAWTAYLPALDAAAIDRARNAFVEALRCFFTGPKLVAYNLLLKLMETGATGTPEQVADLFLEVSRAQIERQMAAAMEGRPDGQTFTNGAAPSASIPPVPASNGGV